MLTEAPKGTKDIYGSYMEEWQRVEQVMRELCSDFGIKEIRIPIFEHTELYLRGVGETTDIVQKTEALHFVPKVLPELQEALSSMVCTTILSLQDVFISDLCSDMKIHRRADKDSSTSLVLKCSAHIHRHLMRRLFRLWQSCLKDSE